MDKRKIIKILLKYSEELTAKNKIIGDVEIEDWLWSGNFNDAAEDILSLLQNREGEEALTNKLNKLKKIKLEECESCACQRDSFCNGYLKALDHVSQTNNKEPNSEALQALKLLVEAKDRKEKTGKDDEYEALKNKAWDRAREVLKDNKEEKETNMIDLGAANTVSSGSKYLYGKPNKVEKKQDHSNVEWSNPDFACVYEAGDTTNCRWCNKPESSHTVNPDISKTERTEEEKITRGDEKHEVNLPKELNKERFKKEQAKE